MTSRLPAEPRTGAVDRPRRPGGVRRYPIRWCLPIGITVVACGPFSLSS